MTLWLERGESRFLDLITTSVYGMVEENRKGNLPDKYTFFETGAKAHSLFKFVHPTILESQIKSFVEVAQGRYIREFAYALVALNFCDDIFASEISNIKVNDISDFDHTCYAKYIQSHKSVYLPNKTAEDFCRLDFASEEWANFLANKALSYGYFCRYVDVINLLSEKSKKYRNDQTIFITQLKNIIGPFDQRVSGSGPDFIQETFKSWAFFLDVVDIITDGELSNYNKTKKLEYLKKHSGYIHDGNKAYRILRNLKGAKIILKKEPLEKIRIMSFMRMANLETWRRHFDDALYSALRRVRILFYLDNRFNSVIDVSELLGDRKMTAIIGHFNKGFNIIEDLLYLECMGYRIELIEERDKFSSLTDYLFEKIISKKGILFFDDLKSIETYSIFYESAKELFEEIDLNGLKIKPSRRFDREIFNKYCPQGELIKWIQES